MQKEIIEAKKSRIHVKTNIHINIKLHEKTITDFIWTSRDSFGVKQQTLLSHTPLRLGKLYENRLIFLQQYKHWLALILSFNIFFCLVVMVSVVVIAECMYTFEQRYIISCCLILASAVVSVVAMHIYLVEIQRKKNHSWSMIFPLRFFTLRRFRLCAFNSLVVSWFYSLATMVSSKN